MTFRQKFIEGLPSNPDDALIELADRASSWIDDDNSNGDALNGAYIKEILATFILRYKPEIQETIFTSDPTLQDYITAIVKFSGSREVGRLLDEYEKTIEDSKSFGFAQLNASEKASLHRHLEKIRSIIEESPLKISKKNALFDRLQKLRSEVDSIGTPTDRFFAFAGDAAFVLGEMAQKGKPFIDEVKEVLKIIRGSRARSENIQLPSDDTLQLPAPEIQSSETV
jgi:hypothetical protein